MARSGTRASSARETAEILNGTLVSARGVHAVTGLAPEDDPDVAAAELGLTTEPLMLVGHLPHLARLAAALVGSSALDRIHFAPGTAVGVRRRPQGWQVELIVPGPHGRRPLVPHLVCVQCGVTTALGPAFEGCRACAADPPAALEVVYDYAALAAAGTLKTWTSRAGGLWRFREVLRPHPRRVRADPVRGRDAAHSGLPASRALASG